jgi:hypothetical protein
MNPTLSEGQGSNDLDELIKADVRGHLLNHGDWKKLSQDTGVGQSTIENFAYGVTTNPQMRTLTRVMDGMGYGDIIRAAYKSDKPVFSEAALKRAPKNVRDRYKARINAAAKAKALQKTNKKVEK